MTSRLVSYNVSTTAIEIVLVAFKCDSYNIKV